MVVIYYPWVNIILINSWYNPQMRCLSLLWAVSKLLELRKFWIHFWLQLIFFGKTPCFLPNLKTLHDMDVQSVLWSKTFQAFPACLYTFFKLINYFFQVDQLPTGQIEALEKGLRSMLLGFEWDNFTKQLLKYYRQWGGVPNLYWRMIGKGGRNPWMIEDS